MPATDLALLEEVAREAGEIACRFWRDDPQVWDKGGDDPVSEADLAVDRHLRGRLLQERPDYGWVSEETEDDAARLLADRVFILDPIDGTRAFVAGERNWAHSIAVAENGRITAGCVFMPVKDAMYLATLGGGATLNGASLAASHRTDLAEAEVLAPRPTFHTEHWIEVPPVARAFRPSLAYRLSLVGEGRFDGMITLRNAWEWDIAAGALIATEAGATVTDRRGQTLSFNTPSRQNAGVIAMAAPLHDEILMRLRT